MEAFTTIWNMLMGIGTIVLMLVGLVFLYAIIFSDEVFSRWVNATASKNILTIGFLVALAALIGSQVYEHVLGYPPCVLCWYARVAIYPIVLLFGMGMAKKDKHILDYALGLTVVGMLVSGYHSVVTVIGESPLPCSSTGVSCLVRFVYEFGFISIPLMVFICFAFIFLLILSAKRAPKPNF